MTAYAVGHLHEVEMCGDIVEYLERIDATLAPFGGQFIIHGERPDMLEGQWPGDLIVIAFADLTHARDWYTSDAYQRILPLRTRHARGAVFLIDGVDAGHKATDILNWPYPRQPDNGLSGSSAAPPRMEFASARAWSSCTTLACRAPSASRCSIAVKIALCRGKESACVFGWRLVSLIDSDNASDSMLPI